MTATNDKIESYQITGWGTLLAMVPSPKGIA
jgi:hypothetical protein